MFASPYKSLGFVFYSRCLLLLYITTCIELSPLSENRLLCLLFIGLFGMGLVLAFPDPAIKIAFI